MLHQIGTEMCLQINLEDIGMFSCVPKKYMY